MSKYSFHHVAISVKDTARSIKFYEHFGFRTVLAWRASDESLTITHLRTPDGCMLEIVCYASPLLPEVLPGVGNNLDRIGVKHFALHVDDVQATYEYLAANQLGEMTEIQHGRTGFPLFFIRDPDGLWLELLSDNRQLDPNVPQEIVGQPRLLPGE